MSTAALIDAYDSSIVASGSEAIAELKANAQRYNEELAADGDIRLLAKRVQALNERSHTAEDESADADDPEVQAAYERYRGELALDGTPIMGYLTIPKLDLEVALYHGTAAEELQKGAGHLIGSSLPVGGPSTHCVIAAHSGLPNAELFSHLTDLRRGDEFALTVLDEKLVYKVDRIAVVEPDQVDALAIQPGRDLCTLLTCTPYGINTHRLLVRGHRIDSAEAAAALPDVHRDDWPIIVGVITAVAVVGIVIGSYRHRNRRRAKAYRW